MKNVCLFIICIALTFQAFAQNDKRLKGIEKELNEILNETKAPGFAVAVVEKNKIIYSKGFGFRDYENKIPADENTLFAIGSCTKSFTSSLLGLLRQEDKLSFDDTPGKHIPELQFYEPDMNSTINIKDMMTHRTGIPRHDYSWYLFPTNNKDSLIQRIEFHKPFTGIREQWYYNNFMFLAQGVIAEKITGISWEENIEKKFFDPLGMTRSNTTIAEMKNSSNAAVGYQLKQDSIINRMDYYDIAAMGAAGSINSSVVEMSNWLITWINNGKFNGEEIIPERYIKEAIGSHMVVSSSPPDKEYPDMHLQNYGYGWFISSYKGHYRVEHGGNIDGFSASTSFFPSDSIGIVVLANQNGSSVPSIVRNTFADRLLNTEKTDWVKWFTNNREKAKKTQKEVKESNTSKSAANTRPSHTLQEFQGIYSHPGYGEFEIAVKSDSLFAHFKRKKAWLKHYHYDVFDPYFAEDGKIDTTESSNIKFNFYTSDNGEIGGLKTRIEPALEDPIEFNRSPKSIEVEASELSRYVGEYEISGMVSKVYIKNNSTLYVFVPGQPEYELYPSEKNEFVFKDLEGFKLEFIESVDEQIESVIFHQPNGSFKAAKKN